MDDLLTLRLTNDEMKLLRELVITERTNTWRVERFAGLQSIEQKLADLRPDATRPNPVPRRESTATPFSYRDPELKCRRPERAPKLD